MTENTGGSSNVQEFTVITHRMSMKDKSSLNKKLKSCSKNLPELEKEKWPEA